MEPDGIKTAVSDKMVTDEYTGLHLRIGIDSLKEIINDGLTVKHLKF
jgi:AMP nucleosidase